MSFEGKNLYGQYIDYSEKKMAQGLHLPLYGTIFYNIGIYSRSQVSVYRTIGPLVFFFLEDNLWFAQECFAPVGWGKYLRFALCI